MVILILLIFLLNVALNVMALKRIDLTRMQFIDGLVLGLTYYVTIPIAVILLYGHVAFGSDEIQDYLPYQDVSTTAVILIGSMMISLMKITLAIFAAGAPPLSRRAKAAPLRSAHRTASRPASPRYQIALVLAIALLYLFATLIFFYESGILNGAHWFQAAGDLMSDSPAFLLLKQISNFTRTAIFGALAALAITRRRYALRIAVIGVLLSITDLFLTFNRITVVYLAVMLLIMSWRRIYLATIIIMAALFSGIYVSSLWPEFRGQVANYGYSLSGMSAALDRAIEVNGVSRPFVDQMNGMFESSNFAVLNWVVKNVDILRVPFGSYVTRAVTVLVPRSLWPDRPESFNATVGAHTTGYGTAMNSFLFGEPFANSPFFWPLLLIVAIVFYDWCFRKMSQVDPSWGTVGALIAVAWWRFDTAFPMVCLIFSVLIFGALLAFPQGRVARKTRSVPLGAQMAPRRR